MFGDQRSNLKLMSRFAQVKQGYKSYFGSGEEVICCKRRGLLHIPRGSVKGQFECYRDHTITRCFKWLSPWAYIGGEKLLERARDVHTSLYLAKRALE